ncbi:L-dopachrome tautomerase-related protein [Plantactinospora sp. CA-290183]|uniref:L-dopachrome tautomerase-related protein n=1 Tax=Plantactinospora sp. CA-290183 TaxID=3240006 RepID=UPI003D903071
MRANGDQDPRLRPVIALDRVCTGVTTTGDGRVFVSFPSADGPGVQVAEVVSDTRLQPFPDAGWNEVRDRPDPDGAFVRVNALRIGPDGNLWIVDAGAPGVGAPPVPGGARVIVVDTDTAEVVRVYDLDPAVREGSYVDDLRFNGAIAYLTDAGAPGLIVLDLDTGGCRRVLDEHPSTAARRPLRADGEILRDPDGAELRIHADQLEVSPDGAYLYYQSAAGPLYRIETRCLDDPSIPPDVVAGRVEPWVDTPTTGGTAIDAAGVIYLTDVDNRRLLSIGLDRRVETLLTDPRLAWGDAMWLDGAGQLWIPAAQLNRTPGLAGGRSSVEYPVWIHRLSVNAVPAANDHA